MKYEMLSKISSTQRKLHKCKISLVVSRSFLSFFFFFKGGYALFLLSPKGAATWHLTR